MWKEYISAASIEEVIKILSQKGNQARVIAGATDLILEMERGQRQGIETLIDVTRIPGLDQITLDERNIVHLGPLVTHNHCVASPLIRRYALPLAKACWGVGSPQIRNRGTVAGNLITASPANDTITPLMALNAWVTLRSAKGERQVQLNDFYQGVRRTVMNPDEMLVDISFPAMAPNQRGTFTKYALRQAQAISLVNLAIILTFEDTSGQEAIIRNAAVTLGAVAPTIIHAGEAETLLNGKVLGEAIISEAAELAMKESRPIDDVRGSANYRRRVVKIITQRALRALANHQEAEGLPEHPIMLWGKKAPQAATLEHSIIHDDHTPIVTRINGKEYILKGGQHKTLLRLLREDAGLIGSKEGCAEGECGACTVHLDGVAVMSCMVPAPRAHHAEIVTVEGLASNHQLHPVQRAFIQEGAVQCGYCTPGLIMASAKLLEERPHPNEDDIRQAITGNLCRCTGYYKIVHAIELAAERGDVTWQENIGDT